MTSVLQHGVLGLSVAALVGAAIRLASPFAESGLDRAISVATFACALAVAEAMLLGFVGLGSEPWALATAALLTWLSVRLTIAPPTVQMRGEFSQVV